MIISAKYHDAAQTIINAVIDHPELGEIPISLTEADYPDLWAEAISLGPAPADIGEIEARAWRILRLERDARLSACDWTVLPDATPQPSLQAWLDYRQELRDLPELTMDPTAPDWPQVPHG